MIQPIRAQSWWISTNESLDVSLSPAGEELFGREMRDEGEDSPGEENWNLLEIHPLGEYQLKEERYWWVQLSYAIKAQLKAPKAFRCVFMA